MSCLQNFSTEEILNNHKERCLLINGIQAAIYETGVIKFKNYDKQIPNPFKIYADSECLLKRTKIESGKHTKLSQKHIPNSTGAKLVCIDNRYTLPTKIVTGSNCINEFIKWVFKQQKYCNQIINNHFNEKLKMTIEDGNNYQNSEDCWICNEKIIEDKVRDHCHITGKYRGPARRQCSLKLKIPRKLPIIFHKLEGYDGHLIFRELNSFKDVDVQVIPKTNERYMSIIVNRNIIFLDSLQFLKASLDNLAGNLENEDFKHLLSELSEDKLKVLNRKDAYPYEWVDSYKKIIYPRLPPKEAFYSSIADGKRGGEDGHISDEQYSHLKNVWNTSNFNIFRDFHNYYLKKDVLLLADVFEKFFSTCLEYNLDPSHYFSLPGLSWDAMLKMTKIELEKISDPDASFY